MRQSPHLFGQGISELVAKEDTEQAAAAAANIADVLNLIHDYLTRD